MTSQPAVSLRTWGRGLVVFGHMIRFSHSIFALPFALAGVLYAYHASGLPLRAETWLWVVAAMVGARTAAMGFNRLVDRGIDAANPRTANRELPRGAVSVRFTVLLVVAASAGFVAASAMLNPLCFALSPLALIIVFFYSYTKRFTWGSHLFLGLALAVAPVGGWVAVTGSLAPEPFLLALAVAAWVAGFDTFYALQDQEFDRSHGLHSIPARFGTVAALRLARVMHLVTVGALAVLLPLLGLSAWYLVGLGIVAAALLYEHSLVKADDLSRLDRAFFDMNGVISVVYLLTAAAGVWL